MPGGPDGKIAARETRDSFRELSFLGAEAKVDFAPSRCFATMLASVARGRLLFWIPAFAGMTV